MYKKAPFPGVLADTVKWSRPWTHPDNYWHFGNF